MGQSQLRCWRFARIEVNEATREMRVRGKPVAVQPRVWELVACLLQRPGEVWDKEQLVAALWPGRAVTDSALTNCINKLRLALGDHRRRIVVTAHGQGYRIGVPVEIGVHQAPYPPTGQPPFPTLPDHPEWRVLQALPSTGSNPAWLIEHRGSGERRVLKQAMDALGVSRLLREWQAFERLHAACGAAAPVVTILDWRPAARPMRLETAWSPLPDLAQRLFDAPADTTSRLEWLALAAEAVETVHAAGVLHEDLRADCVRFFAGGNGRPVLRLADWGESQLPVEGRESLHRRRRAADRPGDVHALGCLLYQTLVRDRTRLPCPGWERDVADPALQSLIGQALASPRGKAQLTAGEFAARLRQAAERDTN